MPKTPKDFTVGELVTSRVSIFSDTDEPLFEHYPAVVTKITEKMVEIEKKDSEGVPNRRYINPDQLEHRNTTMPQEHELALSVLYQSIADLALVDEAEFAVAMASFTKTLITCAYRLGISSTALRQQYRTLRAIDLVNRNTVDE